MTSRNNPRRDEFDVLADPDTLELERRAAMGHMMVSLHVAQSDAALVFASYDLSPLAARKVVARGEAATYDDIRVRPMRGEYRYRWEPVRRGVLEHFSRLHDATDQRILSFARRWGGLNLCRHGLPFSHSFWEAQFDPNCTKCSMLGWGGHSWWEPIQAWRDLSKMVNAVLRIATSLRQERLPEMADWATALSGPKSTRLGLGQKQDPRFPRTVERDAFELAILINDWMAIGQVGPLMHTHKGRPYIRVGGRGLFGVVAFQLALAVSGAKGAALCSSCGCDYKPKRRPAVGRRSYCPACRIAGAPLLDAKRDSRRRKAEARREAATN